MSHPPAEDDEGLIVPELLDASPFAPGSPFLGHYRPPRLGIIHLLAWTAATAVLMKLALATEMLRGDYFDELPSMMTVFRQAIHFVYNASLAAGIVGTSVLLWGKARGVPGRLQPGHWIMTVFALFAILYQFVGVVFMAMRQFDSFEYMSYRWFYSLFGFIGLHQAVVYAIAAMLMRDGRRWKVALVALTVVSVIQSLLMIASVVSMDLINTAYLPLWSGIATAFVAVAALIDLRRRQLRDWLHWLGVAMIASGLATSIAWRVWFNAATRMLNA